MKLKIKYFIWYCWQWNDKCDNTLSNRSGKNQAYPVEKDFPLTGHIEITANIKRHTNVKGIVMVIVC